MWSGTLKDSLLIETIVQDIEKSKNLEVLNYCFEDSMKAIKKRYPDFDEKDVTGLLNVAIGLYNYQNREKVELVITAPSGFGLKARNTGMVIYDMISNAKESITITGYSISDYVSDLIDLIIDKSRKGVYVNLYLNEYENKKDQLQKLFIFNNRYIKIYNYNKNEKDRMASLHAKVIVADRRYAFISSSNLSYHGFESNIELGVMLDSPKKSSEIEEMLKKLVTWKVFSRISIG
ncbi:MAG: phospholipase D-like domain-containing protein [Bacillota bacterium]|nr:phospholipase D-like domain-containing protein [Bacillota bacterium]